jgi:tetratricopeptide (TPR) repeat protein
MIIALWIIGEADEALAFGRAAEELPIVTDDPPLQAVVATHVGAVWTTLGHYHRAEEYLRKVQRVLTGAAGEKRLGRAGFPAVLSRLYLTMGLTDRGAFAEAIATAREALDMADRLDHSWARMLAQWSLAYVVGIRGDLAHATRLLERCLTLARDGNVAFFSAIVAWFLGRTYALSGRLAEGLGLLRAGLAEMQTMGLRPYQAVTLVHEGEVLVLDNRLDDARTSGDRALRLAEDQQQHAYRALAHRLLGEIAARRDPPDMAMAEHEYGAAATLAAELGMRPLTAQCALGLGQLYGRVGDRPRAQQQLAAATALFRELEMPLFLETAQAETAALF